MKDQQGLYYYPDPADSNTRVYVRPSSYGPEFRLWRKNMPKVWEKHGWLAYSVIEAAASMYRDVRGEAGSGTGRDRANPLALYDMNVALALIRQEELEKGRT